MKEIKSKSNLAVFLSRLKSFEKPDVMLEQYPTDSEIAAEIVWSAFLRRDIQNKLITDLGCGTGILGIAALVLGAKKVFFVDIDEKALELAKANLGFAEKELGIKLADKAVFIISDISDLSGFKEKSDVVLENPPFGVKLKHADKAFLEKAMETAPVIYSFHKIESTEFIDKFSRDNGFKITGFWSFDFPLKMTLSYHKKKMQRIKVGCWRLEKTAEKRLKMPEKE